MRVLSKRLQESAIPNRGSEEEQDDFFNPLTILVNAAEVQKPISIHVTTKRNEAPTSTTAHASADQNETSMWRQSQLKRQKQPFNDLGSILARIEARRQQEVSLRRFLEQCNTQKSTKIGCVATLQAMQPQYYD